MSGNDIEELKRYVGVHARGQGIPDAQALIGRIEGDDGRGPGSWVGEWARAGEMWEQRGRDLEACRHYALARFPFANGPARLEMADRCVSAFDRWRLGQEDIEPVEFDFDKGRVSGWATGLSATDPKPLLLVMGGIVTVKEQWAPLLTGARRLGMAALVTEMPGVGENELSYDSGSWEMLSSVIDGLTGRADTSHTYCVALSFSGHMALRCAMTDPRIRGVITVGAPVGPFFTDVEWQKDLPRITVDTLAHLTGIPSPEIPGSLASWALTGHDLSSLDIPVAYTASTRDEIIPAADIALLRAYVRDLHLVEHDDVHGAPRHVAETRFWTVSSLFRARGIRNVQSAAVDLLLAGVRARRRIPFLGG